MKLIDIMKDTKRDNFKILLSGELSLYEIKLEEVSKYNDDWVGIFNEDGKILGSIEKETLMFVIKSYGNYLSFRILDDLEEGIVVLDREGRIFYANKSYSSILGVPRSKVIGKIIHEIEEDASIIEVLKTGKSMNKKNLRIKSLEKYVEVDIHPILEKEVIIGAYSIFNDITEMKKLNKEVVRVNNMANDYLRQNHAYQELKKQNVIGQNQAFRDLLSKALVVAPTNISVLIRGENGVGKEIITKFLYKNSLRKDMPLISINCAAIPENLIESELFGYEEGAFTGATKHGKVGKFKLADGGTLFLDEIGDMPLLLQSKLLRVLQEGEFYPLGAKKPVKVDVRIIAATNQPLEDMMENKLFRQDLYYRLNTITLKVPSLKDRGDDVIIFANFFLNKFNEEYSKDVTLSKEVYKTFLNYTWPGNVRELINCIRSAVILSDGKTVNIEDLPSNIREVQEELKSEITYINKEKNYENSSLQERVKEYEKKVLQDTLDKFKGNREKTMQELKLSRRTFYRKLEILNTK